MIRRLLDAIDGLEVLPHRYPLLADSEAFGVEVRSMPVRPFKVRYQVDDSGMSVTILSVQHGAREDQ